MSNEQLKSNETASDKALPSSSGYALCRYTYDYYEWEEVYAFSFDKDKLREYKKTLKCLYDDAPFVEPEDHEKWGITNKEEPHWTIKEIPFLHNRENSHEAERS